MLIVFVPPEWNSEVSSIALSACDSVAKKTLTLAIIFEPWEIETSYLA